MMEIDAYKTGIFTNIGMDCLHKPVATTQAEPRADSSDLHSSTQWLPIHTGWLKNGNAIVDGHLLSSVDMPLFLPSVVIPEPPQC